MLAAFQKFKQERLEAQEQQEAFCSETVFGLQGWGTPRREPSKTALGTSREYVSWDEVQTFLQMAEQALKVRTQATEALCKELESAKTEKCQVEKTSSAAQEESSFLADSMRGLLAERAALKEALERVQREAQHLAQENTLLRQEVLEDAAVTEEGSAALALLARQQEELRALQSRNAQLENENVQLLARVSALERANTAQATAMLSCLEESERVRLQQLSVCESPVGPLAPRLLHRQSEFTDDSCSGDGAGEGPNSAHFVDALDVTELQSEAGSFSSCATPYGADAAAAAARSGVGTVFHSLDNSPVRPLEAQKQQQVAAQQAAAAAAGNSGDAAPPTNS